MAEIENEGLGLEDSDQLPWLETADDYEYDNSPSIYRVLLYIIMVFLLIASIVAAYFWYKNRSNDSNTQGDGELITAQEGDYKVAPEDRLGKEFEGEGDASFAASEGQKLSSTIGEEETNEEIKADGPIGSDLSAIQLGAFSDVASATNAWTNLVKRFGFLSDDQRKILEGTVDGGRKIYRLQAITNDKKQANDICSKLKAAGENCLVLK